VLTVAVLVVVAVGAGVYIWHPTHHTAYQDGRSWARSWERGFGGAEPWIGCDFTYMVSSGEMFTGEGRDVPGANDPHDNYAHWRAGCMSTKGYYRAQLKANN
jgi:hypothetical protein